MNKKWFIEVREYALFESPTPAVTYWMCEGEPLDGPILGLTRGPSEKWTRTVFISDVKNETDSQIIWNHLVVFKIEQFNLADWGWIPAVEVAG